MTVKRIHVTEDLQARIAAVRAALAIYQPGAESASLIELPMLALADALMVALDAQEAHHAATAAQWARLPRPRPAVVVEVTLRPKRRRA